MCNSTMLKLFSNLSPSPFKKGSAEFMLSQCWLLKGYYTTLAMIDTPLP